MKVSSRRVPTLLGPYAPGDLSTILPTQMQRGVTTPERTLMAAVLEAAVVDARRPVSRCEQARVRRPRGRRGGSGLVVRSVQEEALAYLRSSDATWPFSAAAICEVLGVDREALVAAVAP